MRLSVTFEFDSFFLSFSQQNTIDNFSAICIVWLFICQIWWLVFFCLNLNSARFAACGIFQILLMEREISHKCLGNCFVCLNSYAHFCDLRKKSEHVKNQFFCLNNWIWFANEWQNRIWIMYLHNVNKLSQRMGWSGNLFWSQCLLI